MKSVELYRQYTRDGIEPRTSFKFEGELTDSVDFYLFEEQTNRKRASEVWRSVKARLKESSTKRDATAPLRHNL